MGAAGGPKSRHVVQAEARVGANTEAAQLQLQLPAYTDLCWFRFRYGFARWHGYLPRFANSIGHSQ